MIAHSLILVGAGALAATGVYVPWLWFATPLSFVPFVHVLSRVSPHEPWRAFILGVLFCITQCAMTLISFWSVLPLDWIGLPLFAAIALITFAWFVVSVSMGVLGGLFSLAFVRCRTGAWTDVLCIGSLFVLLQYVQMLAFALLTIAPTSLFGAHFSNIMLGYSLAWFSPLLQLAYLGGIYATTGAAAILGYAMYLFVRTNGGISAQRVGIVIAVLLALTAIDRNIGFVPERAPSDRTLSVAAVSTNFPVGNPLPQEHAARISNVVATVESWAKMNEAPSLLIFPEATDLFRIEGDPETLRTRLFGESDVTIVDSKAVELYASRAVRMFYYGPGKTTATYDKMFFVPQGEYTPTLGKPAVELLGGKDVVASIEKYRTFTRGSHTSIASVDNAKIGGLFCSEVVSPQLYRSVTKQGADILINPSSHAFFHGSKLMRYHMLAASKTRAVENGRFLVTAGNVVPSSIISDRGNVLRESQPDRMSVIAANVPLRSNTTPYVRFGDWVLLVPLLVAVGCIARSPNSLIAFRKTSAHDS